MYEQDDVDRLLLPEDALFARRKRTGGDANERGNNFEMSFATYAVMHFAAQCLVASHDGLDIVVERQPFGFVDDLAFVVNGKELRIECKVAALDWTSGKRPLEKTFKLEQTVAALMNRSVDLILVVSDPDTRNELKAAKPDDLDARIVRFPEVWLPEDIEPDDVWDRLLRLICEPIVDLSTLSNASLHLRAAVVSLRAPTPLSDVMLHVSGLSGRLTRSLSIDAELIEWSQLGLATDAFILSSRGDTLFMRYPELNIWERLPFQHGSLEFKSFLEDMRRERPDTERAVMETIWRLR